MPKRKLKLNQDGFDHIFLSVLFVVIFGIAGAFYYVYLHAATNGVRFVNSNGSCLNNANNAKTDGNPIELYRCVSTNGENWNINDDGTIVNTNGYCLNGTGTSIKSPLTLKACNGSDSQKWVVNTTNNTIKGMASGLCVSNSGNLLADHNVIWLYTCDGGAPEVWKQQAYDPTATSTTPTPTPTPAPSTGAFTSKVLGISGLTHYYPLTTAYGAKDIKGSDSGVNTGAVFGSTGATFSGKQYITLADNNDFSQPTTGQITVVAFLTITDWHGAGDTEYIHWMGKGVSGAQEWTFRHYVQNGTGEAPQRQGRVSFYAFNPEGGLGPGSYFQDLMTNNEMMVVGVINKTSVKIYKNGVLRDTDLLTSVNAVVPKNTTSPVRIGTRDMTTGFLIGKVRRVAFFNKELTQAQITDLWNSRTQAD